MSSSKVLEMNGTLGYNLKASFTQRSRYFSSFSCDILSGAFWSWRTVRTSSYTPCWISGWLANKNILQHIAAEVVSCPSNINVSTSSLISSLLNALFSEVSSKRSKNDIRFFVNTSSVSEIVFLVGFSSKNFLLSAITYKYIPWDYSYDFCARILFLWNHVELLNDPHALFPQTWICIYHIASRVRKFCLLLIR